MKLGVKNFRVFKDLATFDIRPITILVGPNNSGKSSFTKLLLLLKNGYDPLDFKSGEHHLGSYEKALNWDSSSKEMILQSDAYISLISDKLRKEIRFNEKGELKEQSITNLSTGKKLLSIKYKYKNIGSDGISFVHDKVSLDINYIIELLYNKSLSTRYFDENVHELKSTSLINIRENVPADEGKHGVLNFVRGHIDLDNYKKQFASLKIESYKKFHFITNSVLINSINSIDKDYLLYDIYVDGEKVKNRDFLNNELRTLQEECFSSILTPSFVASKGNLSKDSVLKHLNRNVKKKIKELLEEKLEGQIEIKETSLGKLIFTEKLFGTPIPFIGFEESFDESLFMRFSRLLYKNFDFYQSTVYIPVNRGNQERVMSSTTNERTYNEVAKFHRINNAQKERSTSNTYTKQNHVEYLGKVLNVLNIDGKVITDHMEESVAAVYIEQNGRKINLADYGFGYSQLIPIILEVYNLMGQRYSKICLIIEEPEANLHPALQGKLADILAIIIEYNPAWKLVIETHSEYLIRKLQYLVAKKEVNKEDCIIHYFNSDENVSKHEPKVKPIEINEEGNLTDTFGPGFYDEATRLQFELLKLNRTQSN